MPTISRTIFALCVAVILFVVAASLARASDYPPPPPPLPPYAVAPAYPLAALREACAFDVGRYCPAVVPGRGRILGCLNWNWERLRPVCRRGLRRARAAFGY